MLWGGGAEVELGAPAARREPHRRASPHLAERTYTADAAHLDQAVSSQAPLLLAVYAQV